MNGHRGLLSRYDAFQLDAYTATVRGILAHELNAWKGRAELAPTSGRDRYAWGWSAGRNNRPEEALEALLRIDTDGAWIREWPPYWSNLAFAYHLLGRYEEQFEVAEQGLAQHPDVITMLRRVLGALAALGRVDEVHTRSAEIFSYSPRGATTPALVMVQTGLELIAHGYPQPGRDILEGQVEWYRARPPADAAVPRTRNRLAYTLAALERWDEARPILEQLVADFPDNLGNRGLLGIVAAGQGNRDEAIEIRDLLERLDRPYLRGSNLQWAAHVSAMLGEKERAVRLLGDAFARGVPFTLTHHRDPAFASLRDYPPFQEFLRPKG